MSHEPDAVITITLHHTPGGTVATTDVQASPAIGPAAPAALAHAASLIAHEMAKIVSAATLDNAGALDRLRWAPIVGTVPLPPTVRTANVGVA